MVFDNKPHTCGPNAAAAVKYYRTDPFASKPQIIFTLRVLTIEDSNGAEIYFFNPLNRSFCQFFDTTSVLSPATSGIFDLREKENHLELRYKATKLKKFSFYIALLSYNGPTIGLRAIVTREHGVVLVEANMNLNSVNGNISIPARYSLNTTFIMALKPRSKHMQLKLKSGDSKTMTVNWELNTGWTIDPQLNGENRQRSIAQNQPGQAVVQQTCHNCNEGHSIEDCELPEYTMHCTGCLLVSFDGANHINPCMPNNKVSPIRLDLFAKHALTLFQMNYSLADVTVHYWNQGHFSEVNPRVKLISPPSEAVITIQNVNGNQCIALKQSSFKRCCILICAMDNSGIWRFRWRVVVTPNSGVLIFHMTKTPTFQNGQISIPPEFRLNTIAIFGMKPRNSSFYVEVRVHANSNGNLSSSTFDGYTGHFGIDFSSDRDRVFIDNALDGHERKSHEVKFNHLLYQREPKPISTFRSQRVAPPIVR